MEIFRDIVVGRLSHPEKNALDESERLWIFHHIHQFGHDVYLMRGVEQPSMEDVIRAWGIRYEPSESEWMQIDYSLQYNLVPTVRRIS